jgi:tetratricopeptide (TPR) repeat protein
MLSPAQESLALALEFGDPRDIAIARFSVGFALRLQGEVDHQASALMEQSFAEFEELNELFWQARTFPRLGFHLARQGKLKNRDVCLKSLELARNAGERTTLANALSDYADWLLRNGQLDEALKNAEESERLSEQLGSHRNSVNTLNFADIAWMKNDYQKAKALYMELLERCNLFGMRSITPICMANLGLLAMEEGNLGQAQTYLEQALVISREVGWKPEIAYYLSELSNLFYLKGDLEAFKQNFRESLSMRNYLAPYQNRSILLTILGSLYHQKPEISAQLLGIIDHYSVQNDDNIPNPVEKRYCYRAESHARTILGNSAFDTAFTKGQKMSLDEGLDLVLKTVDEM